MMSKKKSASKLFLFFFLMCLWECVYGELLPSWNDGLTKTRILEFVKMVTQKENDYFIPAEDRIAVFDEDGTLWVEQPLYTEFFFALERIKKLAPQHPEWNNLEPFKSILNGNQADLSHFTEQDVAKIVAVTHSGMSVDDFHQDVSEWLKTAIHPRFKRPFTDLVYQPMLEVMQLLHENEFKIYIVSGGGQEFMRAFAKKVYGIHPSHVIGSAGKVKFEYQNGFPVLLKLPNLLFIDNDGGKVEGINLMIGQKPIAAFGNSTGDQQMLEWTQSNKRKNLELLVHHDDAVREYLYGSKSKIGTFSNALMEEAKKSNWIIVSMKNDWKVIFPWQKESIEEHN